MRFQITRKFRKQLQRFTGAMLLLSVLAMPLPAANLVRGPYLQVGTPTSVVVRWRTDVATDSRVRYGLAPGSLISSTDDLASTTEHQVTLAALSPNTRYYYSVGSTTATLSSGPDHTFVTSPATGTSKPAHIWVLGDSGTANANVLAVRDAYQTLAGGRDTDLWLMLGDDAYNSGTDTEFQNAVFAMFPEMLRKSVLWPTRGNHEMSATVYYNIFAMPTNAEAGGVASGTEAYYSFNYGNIHFVCLDSYGSSRAVGSPMLLWLQNDLAANTKDWIIAFWHHPPYSKGSHNSDTEAELIDMRQNALPILESYGVDLVLGGHSHSYERSFLLDGHYGLSATLTDSMKKDAGSGRPDGTGSYQKPTLGPSSHQGAVYTVAGSSGHATGGTLNHPAMYISLNQMGSLVIDVNGNTMDVKFLRETGTIDDYFTIQKGSIVITAPPAITTSSPLANGMASTAYATTFAASGDVPISWSLTGGALPPGMSLHPTGVYTGKPTASGTYNFTVRASNAAGNHSATFTHTLDPLTQAPLSGAALAIPGVIQAEDFDNGGESIAYHDTAAGNSGGKYRNTAVDIETNADGGAGFDVTGTAAGEWLEYTVNVPTAGLYTIEMRVASNGTGGDFHIEFGGVNKTGSITVPGTGGAQSWQTLTIPGVSLGAGQQIMRLALDTIGGSGAVANFNSLNFVVTAAAPPAPSALSATPISSSQINLAWTDNSSNEGGFRIERSTDNVNFTEIATTAVNAIAYSNTGLAASTTYYYRVRAFNSGGNSAYSNTASATTQASLLPAAPTTLKAVSVSKSQINLTWADKSSNEDGFKIERSTNATSGFVEIATTSQNATSYSNTGLAANTRYYYRVRAFNSNGNSAYSNVANTKTKPK